MRHTQSAVQKVGTVYVEVRLRHRVGNGPETSEIVTQVRDYLKRHHNSVKVGTHIKLGFPLATDIDQIEITGHSRTNTFPDVKHYELNENDMDVTVYSLFADDDCSSQAEADHIDSAEQQFNVVQLPSQAFDKLWESLIYAKPIKELTLRALTQAIHERRDSAEDWCSIPWQSTVLLHGAPGSGKTALAQGLAQRLSIRLSNSYSTTKLLQITSHVMFSHLWGETMKKIGEMFDSISRMAADETQLLVVIVDEVETLAGARGAAAMKNEPVDAIRATNEVLRGLDRCRKYENVVFIFTSNLPSTLDPAFVDRCRLEKAVDAPSTDAAFEILRMELNALLARGLIVFNTLIYSSSQDVSYDIWTERLSQPPSVPDQSPYSDMMQGIPSLEWAASHWPASAVTAVSELRRISLLAKGLSGRNLKGLIALARYEHLVDDPSDLHDVLIAFEQVVREKVGRSEDKSADQLQVEEDLDLPVNVKANIGHLSRLPIDCNTYSSDS
ncbi:P-loop containing nucleoside triphosphate hydrolase protein [Phaeosphaeriaceae sp. PMI808]|nr:P-loop containing nucleoside triphosphate hydrolase protein [Phaeosphaeriaceae sp. PMI808]